MNNCRLIKFEQKGKIETGFLVALEENKEVPFAFKRVYYIYGTPEGFARGHHAHKKNVQLLVCVSGSVTVECEDINGKSGEFTLSTPNEGLLIGSMVWHTMSNFTKDAVLLVLASDLYEEKDYIREYNEFRRLAGE